MRLLGTSYAACPGYVCQVQAATWHLTCCLRAFMATFDLHIWHLPTLQQHLALLEGTGSSCLCHEVLQCCMRQRWGALGICEAAAQQVHKKCWPVLQSQNEAFGEEQGRCEEQSHLLPQVEQ